MLIITQEQREQLLKNGSYEHRGADHPPVVKLFLPGSECKWLISELDEDDPDRAWALCDLAQGFPEEGYISLSRLWNVSASRGLTVKIDNRFYTEYPMSIFVSAAIANEAITDDPFALREAWRKSAYSRKGSNFPSL